MAFPTIHSANAGTTSTSSTTASVTLPATISAGDLLMVRIGFSAVGTVTWDNTTAGTWTNLVSASNGTNIGYQIYTKVADGTEGGKTLTITIPSSQIAYRAVAFSGADTATAPEFSSTTGSGANPNSLSLTPSWGSMDTLWLSDEANANGNTTVTAYPSGFVGGTNHTTGTIAGVGIGCSNLDLNAATEDPGAYTLSASRAWIAVTVAIKPSSGGVSSTISSAQAQGATGAITRTVNASVSSSQAQTATGTLTAVTAVSSTLSSAQAQTAAATATRTVDSTLSSAQAQTAAATATRTVDSTLSSAQAQTAAATATRTVDST
ncbi:MAG: hypothetical protein ACYC36_02320, partial [Bellilinea sp.]